MPTEPKRVGSSVVRKEGRALRVFTGRVKGEALLAIAASVLDAEVA
jgi:hypothetical protein